MAAAARQTELNTRVLVVEDEHDVCELMADILEAAGFQVCCVNTDGEAYALLGRTRVAALVVDINLRAGTTGFDVARFARQAWPGLPTLYVSGQASERSFSAFGVPGSVFIEKPFKPDELLVRLQALVHGDTPPPSR